MEKLFLKIEQYFLSSTPYITIGTIIVGIILFKKSKKWLLNYIDNKNYSNQTGHNIIIVYNVFRSVSFLAMIFFILQLHGINVSSLVSAVGVIGIIAGFGVQDSLKDWFSGLNILLNGSFVIGDLVKINGHTGKVVNLDLYVTRIEELYSENIVTISNREISTVEVVSNVIFYNVPFSYEMDFKTCKEMISIMIKRISKLEGVSLCRYDETAEFKDSLINQRIRVELEDKLTLPIMKRKINSIVLQVYDESEWSIPYNHLTVELESTKVK